MSHPSAKLEGKRFGLLTVIARDGSLEKEYKRYSAWLCQCDCGAVIRSNNHSLKRGYRKTCGKMKCRLALRMQNYFKSQEA